MAVLPMRSRALSGRSRMGSPSTEMDTPRGPRPSQYGDALVGVTPFTRIATTRPAGGLGSGTALLYVRLAVLRGLTAATFAHHGASTPAVDWRRAVTRLASARAAADGTAISAGPATDATPGCV